MAADTRTAANTLKRNGKSFWFASLFLPRRVAADAARLYAFCRSMDDLADVAVTRQSLDVLQQVRSDLQLGSSSNAEVQDFLLLARQYDLPCDAADYLIATFLRDAGIGLCLADEVELLRYCHGVAGTVGLMMARILGADRSKASQAAIHLGIAMQMTNIARDVLEDASNHRRYLPGSWVDNLTVQQFLESADAPPVVAAAVEQLLTLADRYYASAALGFPLIPAQSRKAIQIAAAVYREIGEELRRRGFAWQKGRVRVSLLRKLWIAAMVYLGCSPLQKLRPPDEAAMLSHALVGLPGVP